MQNIRIWRQYTEMWCKNSVTKWKFFDRQCIRFDTKIYKTEFFFRKIKYFSHKLKLEKKNPTWGDPVNILRR